MKIAIVTDDGQSISQHFGRAAHYAVIEVRDGQVVGRELRDKAGHHTFHHLEHDHDHHSGERGMGAHSADKHTLMVAAIQDCDMLVARGMGMGARVSMDQAGIETLLVDLSTIDQAMQALLEGRIAAHIHDQLCGGHDHDHHQ